MLDTLAEPVPDAKFKTPLNTLCDMKVEAMIHTLATTLATAKADTLAGTSTNVKADILVNKLKFKKAQAIPQTRGDRLSNVEFEALDDILCFFEAMVEATEACRMTFQSEGQRNNSYER